MAEQASPGKMLPRWQLGQSWKVEYLTWQPSPEKGPVRAPRPLQKNVWRYEVIAAASADSAKVLSIKREDGKRAFEAVFDPQDLTLRSVTEIVRGKHLPVLENAAHEPWFGYSQAQRVIFDWIRFPEKTQGQTSEFKNSDGENVQEQISFQPPDHFTVKMQSKAEPDPGFIETTVSEQTWQVGSPWWSKASVRVNYDNKGEKSSIVFIEGTLLR